MATYEAPKWSYCPGSSEDSMNETLLGSCQQQTGIRGVHFYDGENCEFGPWDLVIEFCRNMKDTENSAHVEFEEKLIHTMSNINAESEFVLCRQQSGVVTIECYRAEGL